MPSILHSPILTRNTDQLKQLVHEHINADAVIQGHYWDPEARKGCFIGCLAHSSNPSPLVERYGLPLPLLRISESIFERLSPPAAKNFFIAFPEAISTDGKDLSLVHWAFLAETLRNLPPQPRDVRAVIDPVIRGMESLASGDGWPKEAASAAWAATNDAANYCDGFYAIRSARAAAMAVIARAGSAGAALSAGDASNRAARAAEEFPLSCLLSLNDHDDAKHAETRRQRDSLLRLLREAPIAG